MVLLYSVGVSARGGVRATTSVPAGSLARFWELPVAPSRTESTSVAAAFIDGLAGWRLRLQNGVLTS